MANVDGRGSAYQKVLYDLLTRLWHNHNVVYEQDIGPLGQRYDIFNKTLGIAIEYDGIQHDKYVEFFHGDVNGYIKSKKMDKAKDIWSAENGIKIVRIKAGQEIYDLTQLSLLITMTPYPDSEYNPLCLEARQTNKANDFARERRKEAYQRWKKQKAQNR